MNFTTAKNYMANTVFAGVTGIRSAFPREPDTLGPTPCAVVGQIQSTNVEPGNKERIEFTMPVIVYVARVSSDDRTIQINDDLVDAIIIASRAHYSLGGAVEQVIWSAVDTDLWLKVGKEAYSAAKFTFKGYAWENTAYTP
jgi:hypothetical protein